MSGSSPASFTTKQDASASENLLAVEGESRLLAAGKGYLDFADDLPVPEHEGRPLGSGGGAGPGGVAGAETLHGHSSTTGNVMPDGQGPERLLPQVVLPQLFLAGEVVDVDPDDPGDVELVVAVAGKGGPRLELPHEAVQGQDLLGPVLHDNVPGRG